MNPLKICPQCGTEYPANARFCEILTVVGAKHLLSNEDRVRAALVTFSAKLSLEDGNACAGLKTVSRIAKGTTKANLVARKLRDLCSE